MRILGVVLVVIGGYILFLEQRKRRSGGGPIILGMNTSSEVMNSIRGMYGVREPGKWQMIVGVLLVITGLGLIVLA